MKRMTGLLLAAVILLGVMSAGTFTVSAESALVASDECIRILKEEEGFSVRPYWDYSQYTVGYGTKCPDDMLQYYRENGITEEEAEVLLKNHLASIELDINKEIVDGYGLNLSQQQFDALVLFSYNCGSGWAFDDDGTLNKALKSGATGNEIIRAFALWCNAGGQIKDFLLRRRLSESNMFLNGEYSRTPPENYCYVLYDANGGVSSPKSQGYDSNEPVEPFPVPTYGNYTFTGWYTERENGTKVTLLDASTKGKVLYAQWVDADGNPPKVEEISVRVTVNYNGVNLRSGPGTNYSLVGVANTGDQFTITQTMQNGTLLWGKFDGGWLALHFTDFDTVSQNPETPTEPTIPPETEPAETTPPETTPPETTPPETTPPETTAPETTPPETTPPETTPPETTPPETTPPETTPPETTPPETTPPETTPPETTAPETTPPETIPPETTPPETTPPATTPTEPQKPASEMGTVRVDTELKIRSGPSTGYTVKGYLTNGTRVEIFEKKTNGSMTWGRIDKGWICLDYVVMDGESGGTAKWTGTIVNCTQLRIRSGAGTSYAHIGNLSAGTKVEIFEKKTNGSTVWGRISQGWISLDYVKLDAQAGGNTSGNDQPSSGSNPSGGNQSGTGSNPAVQWTGTVVNCSQLRIRSGAGVSFAHVGNLAAGTRVEIFEKKTNGSTVWGKIDKGWISLDYVQLDSGSSSNTTQVQTGTVSSDEFLRVRSGPGTTYSVLGYLYPGDKVQITEKRQNGSMTWGKIDKGWISLDYVRFDNSAGSTSAPTTPETTVTKTVTTDCLRIRSGAGTSHTIVGYLYYGAKVEVTETKVVSGMTWGKTSKGWISLEYTK